MSYGHKYSKHNVVYDEVCPECAREEADDCNKLEQRISALEAEIGRLQSKLAKAMSMEIANNHSFDYAVALVKELHDAWLDPGITVYAAFEETKTLRWRVEQFLKVTLPHTDAITYEAMMAGIKRLTGKE